MIILFSLASLSVIGLLLLVHAAVSAPEGYEDASGFHFIDAKKAGAQAPAIQPLNA